MKLLSIREVWAAEQAQGVRVPHAVVSAARAALARYEDEGGASLGSVARARELAKGVVGRPVVARIAGFFSGRLEKSLDSVGAQLHGGPAGREWAADIMKAADEPEAEEETPADPKAEHRDLRRRLSMIMSAHGDDGVPITTFKDHVDKHGHQAVARALRELGADHVDGRVLTRRSRAPATVAPKPKPKPKPTAKAKPKTIAKAVVLAAPPTSSWRPMRFWGQS